MGILNVVRGFHYGDRWILSVEYCYWMWSLVFTMVTGEYCPLLLLIRVSPYWLCYCYWSYISDLHIRLFTITAYCYCYWFHHNGFAIDYQGFHHNGQAWLQISSWWWWSWWSWSWWCLMLHRSLVQRATTQPYSPRVWAFLSYWRIFFAPFP